MVNSLKTPKNVSGPFPISQSHKPGKTLKSRAKGLSEYWKINFKHSLSSNDMLLPLSIFRMMIFHPISFGCTLNHLFSDWGTDLTEYLTIIIVLCKILLITQKHYFLILFSYQWKSKDQIIYLRHNLKIIWKIIIAMA